MKTILVGNGYNIELGGSKYLNKSIINRAISNIRQKDYSEKLFNNKISNEELASLLPGLLGQLNLILNDDVTYEKLKDEESVKLITLLKERYGSIELDTDSIGIEDFFVLLKLMHSLYNDDEKMVRNTNHGMCWILFDAIYNEGKIQEIYNGITPHYLEFLKNKFSEYDDIYTVNYDNTVEKTSGKDVKYLHGSFDELLDQYDPRTVIGFCNMEDKIENPVNEKNKHIYSNALMGFSGIYKEHIINVMENGQEGVVRIIDQYLKGSEVEKRIIENLYDNAESEEEKLAHQMINAIISNPELYMKRYPMKEFKAIQGELEIIGLSPFNDEHIWKNILENDRITHIVYYYHSEDSKEIMQKMYCDSRIEYIRDKEFWNDNT